MVGLVIAAVVLSGLGDRPQAILGADGKTAYQAKLEEKLAAPMLGNLLTTAFSGCETLAYTATDYVELQNQDFGPNDAFYQTVAVKPAIMEHVQVSGCDKTLRINLMVVRLQSNPNDLKMAFQISGGTLASPILQRDAYRYVAMATDAAKTLAGDQTSCDTTAMVYDTQVVTKVNGRNPWQEKWLTSKCGFKAQIVVDFTPTPDGGTDIGARPLRPGE